MNTNINNLYKISSSFYKQSGELQFPEKLYKEICSFIISAYCSDIKLIFKNSKDEVDNFSRIVNKLNSKSQEWHSIKDILNECLYNHTIIEDIIGMFNKPRVLPNFDESVDSNPLLYNSGTIDLSGELSVMFQLGKNASGKYKIKTVINYKTGKPGAINYNYVNHNSSLPNTINKISGFIDKLEIVLGNFDKLIEKYSTAYVKNEKEINPVLATLNSYITENISGYTKEFEVSTDDMPYSEKLQMPRTLMIIVQFHGDQESAESTHSFDDGVWQGLWSPVGKENFEMLLGYLDVYADVIDGVGLFHPINIENKINSIKQIVRHELRHMVQTYGRNVLNLNMGYHSKKPNIKGIQFENLKEHNNWTEDEKNEIDHVLDDVEFYTNLSDEIYNFNKYVSFIPMEARHDYMLAWIDQITPTQFFYIFYNILEERAKKILGVEQSDNIKIDDKIMSEVEKMKTHTVDITLNQIKRDNKDYNQLSLNNLSPPEEQKAVDQVSRYYARSFFKFLKKHQFEKYKKAVKEFVKAVNV